MSTAGKIRIAVAQTEVTTDAGANGAAIRDAMRHAADHGSRLVHFGQGALSGYAGAAKPYYTGWRIDWAPVTDELRATMALAAEFGIWVVAGGNHRLSGDHRPHNSLWVINDRGELADRYDKRLVSHAEITAFYTPGDHACTFEVDGFRFGCLLCIEVNFPELWLEHRELGVDCVLFSTYSEDPIFEVIARGHAAANGYWVSIAVPAQRAPAGPSAVVGPTAMSSTRPFGPAGGDLCRSRPHRPGTRRRIEQSPAMARNCPRRSHLHRPPRQRLPQHRPDQRLKASAPGQRQQQRAKRQPTRH